MKNTTFRGKHITTGEWLYGSLIHRGEHCFILPFEGEPTAKETEVVPETVGQLTGEIDKHGKEVWQGDWVLAEGLGDVILTLLIGWGNRGFTQIDEDGHRRADWFHVIEVIGNIHDDFLPAPPEVPNEEVKDPWRCGVCGSLSVQQRAWIDPNYMEIARFNDCDRNDYYCAECEDNHYFVRESELLEKARDWWNKADFKVLERITGYRQSDFDPVDGYFAFADACDIWWLRKAIEEKVSIYLENQ
jgi:hypothetical protein